MIPKLAYDCFVNTVSAKCSLDSHFSVAENKTSHSPYNNELLLYAGHYASSVEHAPHLPAFITSILSMYKVSNCALKLWSDNRHASHLNMYSVLNCWASVVSTALTNLTQECLFMKACMLCVL